VTYEALEDLSRSGVRYLEMFFSPQAPMQAGAHYPEILEGICSGLRDGERDFKIVGRLIPAHNRELGLQAGLEFLDLVLAHRNDDIIGIGIDFSEVKSPPALFPELFSRAREAGLHRTAHAGEEGPGAHVRDSIALLDCERIDHGYRVSEDPEAVQLARERGTYFTVCPSLVRSFFGDFPPAQDPIQRMDDLGLKYVIASDDPAMLHSNLLEEYCFIGDKLGFGREKYKDLALNGLRASWLDETTRSAWLREWSCEIDAIS
jgi:adenosine deaminase